MIENYKNRKIITIGIPTYRRPNSLTKILSQISSESVFYENAMIVIVNDSGSKEFENEYIKAINTFGNIHIEYIRNKINLGLPRSFLILLENTKTKYLFYMSDDDILISQNLPGIINFILEKKPYIVSPQWIFKNGRFGRGINKTRKIKPEEFRLCCGHAPGVIFNVEIAKEFVPIIEKRINTRCTATYTYPLVAFSIPIFLKYDNCWWYGKPLVMEGDNSPSQIRDPKGYPYYSINSRIQQIADFDDYILSFPESELRNRILKASRAWSLQKAINLDKELKKEVLFYISPPIKVRILRRFARIFKKF